MRQLTTKDAYTERRSELAAYFDRTAAARWVALTSASTRPLGMIRRTVREGRERMHATLLGWLRDDLRGHRVLDAGCGTGTLVRALAERGATVVGVDVAPTLVRIAEGRTPASLAPRISYVVGDMLDPSLGTFDHVLLMDSLIHYDATDAVAALAALTQRTRRSVLFTFAPRTPLLAAMHAVGRTLPRGHRAPALVPVPETTLRHALDAALCDRGWRIARTRRVASGFYTSHGVQLEHAGPHHTWRDDP